MRLDKEPALAFCTINSAEKFDKENLEKLWYLLKSNTRFPDDGSERMNYDQSCSVANKTPS